MWGLTKAMFIYTYYTFPFANDWSILVFLKNISHWRNILKTDMTWQMRNGKHCDRVFPDEKKPDEIFTRNWKVAFSSESLQT